MFIPEKGTGVDHLFRIQHELIADRTAEAWYRTNIAGPFFHYRWQYGSGPDGPFSYVQSEHHDHAVCREEPSLTMSWGMNIYEDRRDLQFDWAEAFVNSTVRPFWVDFFWNNALIDRVELCRMDGGHGTIPIPGYRREVSDFAMAVAWLIHGLEGSSSDADPDHYVAVIEAKRVRDEARQGAGSHHA
jgi:hypothetical protein